MAKVNVLFATYRVERRLAGKLGLGTERLYSPLPGTSFVRNLTSVGNPPTGAAKYLQPTPPVDRLGSQRSTDCDLTVVLLPNSLKTHN